MIFLQLPVVAWILIVNAESLPLCSHILFVGPAQLNSFQSDPAFLFFLLLVNEHRMVVVVVGVGGTFHRLPPEKQKQPLSKECPTSILCLPASPRFCFPSPLTELLPPRLCTLILPLPPPVSPTYPAFYNTPPTPTPPLLQLLHKLPVIDPGHIALVFPLVCLWEPQHPRPTLNEATTKTHWWEAQCERGWPQPRAPRTVHQLPQALPPHKDAHCGQRPEKAQRTRRGERNVKRG